MVRMCNTQQTQMRRLWCQYFPGADCKPPSAWPPAPGGRQLLQAARLEVTHPRSGERMNWEAPLPEDFQAA